MGRFRDCLESLWDRVKAHSGVMMVVGSMIVFAFGCFFLIAGAYVGATYTTQTEQGAVIAAAVAGALLIVFSCFGAVAYKTGHGFFTRFLFVFAFGLFIAGIALCGVALTYLHRIQILGTLNPQPFPFSQNITDPALRDVSDYLNSIYTTCCTGCTVAICNKFINETGYCPQQLSIPNPPCAFVVPCPATPQGDPDCFFGRGPNNTVPPFEIGQGMCDFLKSAAWGPNNMPVVGEKGGNDINRISCGGGDPKVFAFSVSDWLFSQYAWISAIVGIVLFVLIIIMVASCAYDVNLKENYKPKRVKE